MPPEVPTGTRRQVRIERGVPPYSVPISVAHVSAADAASEPAPRAIQRTSGRIVATTAATANIAPFANTCVASRAPPLATIDAVRRSFDFFPTCDSAVDDAK